MCVDGMVTSRDTDIDGADQRCRVIEALDIYTT